tara:strand:+ start:8975 stop:9142 length:168 start_codon:yes stop_codon:yes gene_type:complete
MSKMIPIQKSRKVRMISFQFQPAAAEAVDDIADMAPDSASVSPSSVMTGVVPEGM